MQTRVGEQLCDEWLREIALVTEELAKQAVGQSGHRLAIIDVAGGEVHGQQFTVVVDHQMELEAKEPAHRGLAACGQPDKDLVLTMRGLRQTANAVESTNEMPVQAPKQWRR